MGIVESESPRRHRISRLEKLAGGAIIAAAAFAATAKLTHASEVGYLEGGGTSTDPNAANAVSWFNTINWDFLQGTGNTGPTGTLPEAAGPGPSTGSVVIGQANLGQIDTGIGMPSVGVVFDPADDLLTPGGPSANYVANIYSTQGSLIVGQINGNVLGGTVTATPSKLTIESGTIIAGGTSGGVFVGRDEPATLVQNGGVLIGNLGGGKLELVEAVKTTALGQGTYEYHGGTIETAGISDVAANTTCGIYQTSAAVGSFVVYNDGPDGAILSSNGFLFDSNSKGFGDIGFVEFHYDLNTGGIGGVRPIQANWNNEPPGTTKLAILNGTAAAAKGFASLTYTIYSSRLNLVLDTAPSVIGGYAQNLGLFDETAITGNGTFSKAFYSADGSTVFTQGATISAVYGGNTYSWTISYSGQIQFTNTAVSGYNSTGILPTGGTDVVLIGITSMAVLEPSTVTLLGGAASMILARRRQRNPRAVQT